MVIFRNTVFALLIILLIVGPIACAGSNGKTSTPQSSASASNPTTYPPTGIPQTPTLPTQTPTANFTAINLSDAIANVVQQVQPAVVFISAKIETKSFFFNQGTIESASGSGVIISPDGYILTNNHVVENAVELKVTLPGMVKNFEAKVVGTDPLTDLAVIKIKGKDFPTASFGNASALRPGNLVIAMGYPLALENGSTITLGVVSNTERSFTLGEATYYDAIQTDAAINPGNSGGPLVDLKGGIVGIDSVLAGTAQNIGFAISANTAQPVYEALIGEEHRVIRPWLGVQLQTVTPDVAAAADLSRQSGVVIGRIEAGSPADKAGLRVRDVITNFDGKEVTEATQLIKELWAHHVGDNVRITYWRGNKETEVVIKLSMERPEQP